MSGRGKRMCTVCGRTPTAFPRVDYCFGCWPGGPVTPPPCLSCGSRSQYFVAGLCHRCHKDGHPDVESCRNCLAWGATRHLAWLCKGCNSWCRKYTLVDDCTICRRRSTLDDAHVCRLCRKQGAFWRQPHEQLDLLAANRHGQQLFIADLFYRRDKNEPVAQPQPVPAALPVHRLAPQLVLFEVNRDLSARGYRVGGLAERADPSMAAAMDQIVAAHAARYGWNHDLGWKVRTGVRVLLAFQDTPGDAITASEAAVLAGTELPMSRVLDVFAEAGMLVDDRTPVTETWFRRQVCGLPEPMTGELRQWFTIMLHGSRTPPRRNPRSPFTARLYLGWALPALRSWAAEERQSLREISTDDVRAILPRSGNPRAVLGQALRSIFSILKARKVVFTNPLTSIKTGYAEPKQPLPVVPGLLRAGLDSPDPARAAVIALVAFHGLRSAQLCQLKLTDVRDGRLHIDDRVLPLAEAVRTRLATYLDYRNTSWPHSANPHLFLTTRSANGITPVGRRWLKLKVAILGAAQAVREDRILDEAQATRGDVRRICDMFGLSVTAAERYAATVDNPDLVQAPRSPGDGRDHR